MTVTWPRARPAAGERAVIKAEPADFHVVELPAGVPAGDGEHLLLRLEKTDLTTPAVARWLAGAFGVPEMAVGYAGLKDRRAVTEQWFSVHTPRNADALPPRAGVRLLEAVRHRCKLRRGELAGNRFRIRLTGVSSAAWRDGLRALRDRGAPNYFGRQRFGRDNLARARAWLSSGRRRRLPAFEKGLYLSVARSFLFNEVLAARVRDGTWNQWLDGDVAAAADTAAPAWPSGPLWGRGRSPAAAAVAALEQTALAPHRALCDALEHVGLGQQRRSLVVRPADLSWQATGDGLAVSFSLPPGSYATTVLGEVFELAEPRAAAP